MKREIKSLFRAKYRAWINGKEYKSTSKKYYNLFCPATELPICQVEESGINEVNYAVRIARESFNEGVWSKKDVRERSIVLQNAANILRTQLKDIAMKECIQTGRAIREMNAQLERLPEWLEYFAALIRTQEGTVPPFKGNYHNYVQRVPLGVVAQITPFNHPMLIAIKKISVGLSTGNSIVLKPPDLAPCSILDFAETLKIAGLPDGVFNVVPGLGSSTGHFLTSNKDLDKIDFTGSTEAGKNIGSIAGQNVTAMTSELGGKTPIIVFEDADIEQAVKGACFGAFIA